MCPTSTLYITYGKLRSGVHRTVGRRSNVWWVNCLLNCKMKSFYVSRRLTKYQEKLILVSAYGWYKVNFWYNVYDQIIYHMPKNQFVAEMLLWPNTVIKYKFQLYSFSSILERETNKKATKSSIQSSLCPLVSYFIIFSKWCKIMTYFLFVSQVFSKIVTGPPPPSPSHHTILRNRGKSLPWNVLYLAVFEKWK